VPIPHPIVVGKAPFEGRRTAQPAGNDFWTQVRGSGTAAGFIDHAAVPSGERAEPAVAHDFPQNGRGLFEAPVPIDFFEFVRR
jgi:hypothetical protein